MDEIEKKVALNCFSQELKISKSFLNIEHQIAFKEKASK